MNLPIIWPDLPRQRFECRSCANCCRELVVHLTRADRAKIDKQKWGGRIEGEPYLRLGSSYVLRHRPGGGCVFLADDGKCRIHAEFGATEKPAACQLYPFTLEAVPGGVHVALRFDCPTVAANGDAPIETRKSDIQRLSGELQSQSVIAAQEGDGSVTVARGVRLPRAESDQFVAHVVRWLRTESVPMPKRLHALGRLTTTLHNAKLKQLDAVSANELVIMLAAGIRELAEDTWDAPVDAPSNREMRLLRQTVFSHCEHVTFEQIVSPLWTSMRFRLNQLNRARAMSAGAGTMPMLRGVNGTPAFDAIERVVPDASLSEKEVDGLLLRYLLARFEGRSVFGPGYYGFSIVEGLAALHLSIACIGWMTRCLAAVRQAQSSRDAAIVALPTAAASRVTYTMQDIEKALGLVDRATGRVPELGAKSARLRLRYFLDLEGLNRLVHRYAPGAK